MDPRNIFPIPPFMFPMAEHEPINNTVDDSVPTRVIKAMEFLAQTAALREKRTAVACENAIEVVEQQCLYEDEKRTKTSALEMLSSYFDGKLEMNHWEELKHNANKEKIKDPSFDEPKTLLRCIQCNPTIPPNPKCPICKGSGKILIQTIPANSAECFAEAEELNPSREEKENDS